MLVWNLLVALASVLGLIAVAAFFTMVLAPAVDFFEHRAGLKRGVATTVNGFRFPAEIIVLSVGWDLRHGVSYPDVRSCWPSVGSKRTSGCSASYRDVDELLAERGIEADTPTTAGDVNARSAS